MADLTAVEQLEKLQGSLSVSEERLLIINQKLPEMETELEDLVVRQETQGYKGRTIAKLQDEIDALTKEKAALEKTVGILKKKMPEYEKTARIEKASDEDITNYQQAFSAIMETLKGLPSLDILQAEVERIEQYASAIAERKNTFLNAGKGLADFLQKEKIDAVKDTSLSKLREDRAMIDYTVLAQYSDAVMEVSQRLNDLQFDLFQISINNPDDKKLPPVVVIRDLPLEVSPCGRFAREMKEGTWILYKKDQRQAENSLCMTDYWRRVNVLIHKPDFPKV